MKPSTWRDDALLLDILIASRRIQEHTRGVNAEQFRGSPLVQDATMRLIGFIGEAAAKVSPDFQTAHPEIPWPGMVGMRHRIVHDYFGVDVGKVWDTVIR